MKNLKQLVIGILIGIIVATQAMASEESYILKKAGYKIIVNNKEYTDSNLPTLEYNGSTYIPLRNISKILNTDLKWNENLNQVEISNKEVKHMDEFIITRDNIEYIDAQQVSIETENKQYTLCMLKSQGKCILYDTSPSLNFKEVQVLDNIKLYEFDSKYYITNDDYITLIAPLLDKR